MNRSKRVLETFRYLRTKEGEITFLLIRSSGRRSLTIHINEKADVRIYAPFNSRKEGIDNFVKEKAAWILKKVGEANQHNGILAKKKFESGQDFLFLGKKHRLQVSEQDVKQSRLRFDGNQWDVCVPLNLTYSQRQSNIKGKMVQWYRTQAKEVLGGRVFHFSRVLGVEPKEITVRTQKRMWGSCHHHTKKINLNWQLVLSPPEVIDYVVVHELCHLIFPNHSQRFWKRVEKILPEFKQQKRWLKANSFDMMLPNNYVNE